MKLSLFVEIVFKLKFLFLLVTTYKVNDSVYIFQKTRSFTKVELSRVKPFCCFTDDLILISISATAVNTYEKHCEAPSHHEAGRFCKVVTFVLINIFLCGKKYVVDIGE